jgi:hypothetical protein
MNRIENMKTTEQIKIQRQTAISNMKGEKKIWENCLLCSLVLTVLCFGLGVILTMSIFWWLASLFLLLAIAIHGLFIKQLEFFIEVLEQMIDETY